MEPPGFYFVNLQTLINDVNLHVEFATQAASVMMFNLPSKVASEEYFYKLLNHILERLDLDFREVDKKIDPHVPHLSSLQLFLEEVYWLTRRLVQQESAKTPTLPMGTVRQKVFNNLRNSIQERLIRNFNKQVYTRSVSPLFAHQNLANPINPCLYRVNGQMGPQSSQSTGLQMPQSQLTAHRRQIHHANKPHNGVFIPPEVQCIIIDKLLEDCPAIGSGGVDFLPEDVFAVLRTSTLIHKYCKRALYNVPFFAAFVMPPNSNPNSAYKQHAIMTPLTRNWDSPSVFMARNYLCLKTMTKLAMVLNWIIYIRPDEVLPDIMGIIALCHFYTIMDSSRNLSIEVLIEPKKPGKTESQYITQISSVLEPFTWLRNLKSFTVRLAEEGEGEHFPSKDKTRWGARFRDENFRQSDIALDKYLNQNGIEAICEGNSPRYRFVREFLKIIRLYQAYELDVDLKLQIGLNADGQVEFLQSKFPTRVLDPEQLHLWLLPHFRQVDSKALIRARACITTSDLVGFREHVQDLRDAADSHHQRIDAVRQGWIKPVWFGDYLNGTTSDKTATWTQAFNFVKRYSDTFFRYDLSRIDMYSRKHVDMRETLKGMKTSLPHEKLLREANGERERGSALGRRKLGEVFNFLEGQWQEAVAARNTL